MRRVWLRLSEPSTWAGMSGLALLFGLSAEEWSAWSQGLAAICALAAMFLRERGSDAVGDNQEPDQDHDSTDFGGL